MQLSSPIENASDRRRPGNPIWKILQAAGAQRCSVRHRFAIACEAAEVREELRADGRRATHAAVADVLNDRGYLTWRGRPLTAVYLCRLRQAFPSASEAKATAVLDNQRGEPCDCDED